MATALDTLLANDVLRAALGVRGRGRAEAFDIDVIAREYTRLFLQVAAGREAVEAPAPSVGIWGRVETA